MACTIAAEGVARAYWAAAESVIVELPLPLLADGLELVDLPGVGDTDAGRVEATINYVKTADQFVMVVSTDLFTESVRNLMVGYNLLVNLLQRKRPLILFGTKLDQLYPSPAELAQREIPQAPVERAREELFRQKAREGLHELLRPIVNRIDPFDGQESLDAFYERIKPRFERIEIMAVREV